MPRTFSLARLMIGITLIAVACAFVRNYPDYALIGMVFVPPTFICLALVCVAGRRKLPVLFLSIVGALLGGVVSLMAPRAWPTSPWDGVNTLLIPVSLGSSLFAFMMGAAALRDDSRGRGGTNWPPSAL